MSIWRVGSLAWTFFLFGVAFALVEVIFYKYSTPLVMALARTPHIVYDANFKTAWIFAWASLHCHLPYVFTPHCRQPPAI